MSEAARRARIGFVVCAVARRALEDRGLARVALLDDGGPEASLAAALLAEGLGAEAVARVTATEAEVESLLRILPHLPAARRAEEARRAKARGMNDALPAHPASRTALLLGGALPPEPFLPLGDLPAAEVARLAGGWSAPAPVVALAERAGGIDALDAALRAWLQGRDPAALDARLGAETAEAVRAAFAAGRPDRMYPRTVPQLDVRTLFLDLLE